MDGPSGSGEQISSETGSWKGRCLILLGSPDKKLSYCRERELQHLALAVFAYVFTTKQPQSCIHDTL